MPWISIVRYENLPNSHKVFLKSMTTLLYTWNCYLNCDAHIHSLIHLFSHVCNTCNIYIYIMYLHLFIHICFNIHTGIPGKYCGFSSRPLQQRSQRCWGFPVHIKLCLQNTVVYWMCNSIMSKKCTYLYLKLLFAKKCHHLSFQQVMIFLLVEGFTSVLMIADWSGWWMLKVLAIVKIS